MHKREYFIYRIATGKLYFDKVCIHKPDEQILYDAEIVYHEYFDKAMNDGVYKDTDMVSILMDRDIWSIEQEARLKFTIPQEIDDLKVQLFNIGTSRSIDYISISNKIDKKYTELAQLNKLRHSLDHFTCNGIAVLMKNRFLIKQCARLKNKKINWKKSKHSIDNIMQYKNSSYIIEEDIRDLCLSQSWSDIWASARKNNGFVFEENALLLSDEQRRMILWSSLYDNSRDYEDYPGIDIVKDHRMFDGWLITKKEQQDKKPDKPINITNNSKINNAQEVFIMTNGTQEDIQEKIKNIQALNTFESNIIKKSRAAKVRQENSVDFKDFSDVKRDLRMKATNLIRKSNGR